MKRLLARRNLAELGRVARSNVLLGFDFDGTLAPIVSDRELAAMRARTVQLFRQVCLLYPCAVISGRSLADVGLRLGNAAVKYLVGNHGLEPGKHLGEFAREVARVQPVLALSLAHVAGVEIEHKTYSLAVHYRHAKNKRAARQAIHHAVSGLPLSMRMVLGKLVVNLVPATAAHKGQALLELCCSEAVSSAFFVGDDVTDEDVFRLPSTTQPELFTVRVGRSKRSAARYFLHDQREIDSVLTELIGLRRPGAG